jgi:hypothetical protein
MKKLIAFLVPLLLWSAIAGAQYGGGTPTYSNWGPMGVATLALSTASVSVAIPCTQTPTSCTGGQIAKTVKVCNTGDVDAYIAFGNSSVVASSSSYWLRGGKCIAYNPQPFASPALYTFLAAITLTGSTSLYIESGVGSPNDSGQTLTGGGGGSNAPYTFTPLGCNRITALTAAAGWVSIPSGALLVALDVEGQAVRYRDDGTAPTASVGVLLPVGGPWPYSGTLGAIQFIQVAATATINGCFYK